MLYPDGRIATWNAGAQRMKGWRADEIIGRHFRVCYPSEDVVAGKCERVLSEAMRVGRWEDEGWRIRKDGSRFWANVVITAVHDATGRLHGFAKVTRDLTERRSAEAERLRLVQAEEAVRLRDEFLSVASHELRTPLTTLRLELEGLAARSAGFEPRDGNRLKRAARSAERLSALVEALLDVSRISVGQLVLVRSRFDLADVVREVAGAVADAGARLGSPLHLSAESMPGEWDRIRVEQVLMNLLGNALKYGAGAPVAVGLHRDHEHAVLEVTDGGPGIPEDALARIFGRFERAVSHHHYGGLGLGLYVSREIVEAHGGSISAENVPGGGARLVVRLPLEARAEPEPEPEPPSPP
jgi:PAS domain S-box-containing protein